MIYNYVTIESIIEKINRYHNPLFNFNPEEIKEWVYEALSKIGVKDQYIEKSYKIEIDNGVGKLPSGVEKVISITEGDSNYPMVHLQLDKAFVELSYKIDVNGYIRTDFKEGYVTINYLSFPIDDRNNPLIPDAVYFIAAVESFCKYKLLERAFYQNKIQVPQLQYAEREWLFYCPAAVNSTKMFNNQDSIRGFAKEYLTTFPNPKWLK